MDTYEFTPEIFDTFTVVGLEERMEEIIKLVQPLFHYYGEQMSNYIEDKLKTDTVMPVHVAKHLRRTKYAPDTTWVAIGGDKRGYKKYPHFQMVLNEKYVFVGLAIIDNPIYEKEIAKGFKKKIKFFQSLPQDMAVIPDHTDTLYIEQKDCQYRELFERLEKVKKAEFMIGRVLDRQTAIHMTQAQMNKWVLDTVEYLLEPYVWAIGFYMEKPKFLLVKDTER